jgi:hypothetical protein
LLGEQRRAALGPPFFFLRCTQDRTDEARRQLAFSRRCRKTRRGVIKNELNLSTLNGLRALPGRAFGATMIAAGKE